MTDAVELEILTVEGPTVEAISAVHHELARRGLFGVVLISPDARGTLQIVKAVRERGLELPWQLIEDPRLPEWSLVAAPRKAIRPPRAS